MSSKKFSNDEIFKALLEKNNCTNIIRIKRKGEQNKIRIVKQTFDFMKENKLKDFYKNLYSASIYLPNTPIINLDSGYFLNE